MKTIPKYEIIEKETTTCMLETSKIDMAKSAILLSYNAYEMNVSSELKYLPQEIITNMLIDVGRD